MKKRRSKKKKEKKTIKTIISFYIEMMMMENEGEDILRQVLFNLDISEFCKFIHDC
jgi:hypothetical protein